MRGFHCQLPLRPLFLSRKTLGEPPSGGARNFLPFPRTLRAADAPPGPFCFGGLGSEDNLPCLFNPFLSQDPLGHQEVGPTVTSSRLWRFRLV